MDFRVSHHLWDGKAPSTHLHAEVAHLLEKQGLIHLTDSSTLGTATRKTYAPSLHVDVKLAAALAHLALAQSA